MIQPLTDKSIRTDGKDCQTMDKSCQYYGTSLPKTCEDNKKTPDIDYRALRTQITENELERTPGEVVVSGIYGRAGRIMRNFVAKVPY